MDYRRLQIRMNSEILYISDDEEELEFQLGIAQRVRRQQNLQRMAGIYQVEAPDNCVCCEGPLLGPIRAFCHDIIVRKAANRHFPYKPLKQMEAHLKKISSGISFKTEAIVWKCVFEELSRIRLAYADIIDVGNFTIK